MTTSSTKAQLVEPHAEFCSGGMHSGVWRRKTIVSCWRGKLIRLKTDTAAPRTTVCHLIRVGDEFFAATGFGDAQKQLREYEQRTGEKLLPVRPHRETGLEKLARYEALAAAQPNQASAA